MVQNRGVDLVVLDQGINTSTALGRRFFPILGSIAEFEHALMSERTVDGLTASRARGRTGGDYSWIPRVRAPSTMRFVPLVKLERGLARNATAVATSCGVPMRPVGLSAIAVS